jgi:hypothetical protein
MDTLFAITLTEFGHSVLDKILQVKTLRSQEQSAIIDTQFWGKVVITDTLFAITLTEFGHSVLDKILQVKTLRSQEQSVIIDSVCDNTH